MDTTAAFATALKLALFAAAALGMLAWTGYGPAAFLLPTRFRPYALLLIAPIGYCWFALLSSVLNSTFFPMAVATPIILAIAGAANLAALRWRRLPLPLTPEIAAVAMLSLVPFGIAGLPLLNAGSTAFVGNQWDLEVYLPITEYLKRYAIGARLEALSNPLTTLLNAPDFRGGSGWGFSYVEAGVGTVVGWASFLTFRPMLHLLMTLSVPCVWFMARELFGLDRRGALLAAALWSVNGLSIWLASIGLAGHAASFALLPLALTLSFHALEEPAPESIVLAGSAVAGLVLNFYTGAAPFYALPVAGYGLVLLLRGPDRRRTLLAGAALLAAVLVLAPVAHLRFLAALDVYFSKGLSQGWSIHLFSPVAQFLGFSPFLLVEHVTETGVIMGETGREDFLFAGWVLTLVAAAVALVGVTTGKLERARLPSLLIPVLAFAAFLRFGLAYPYGYFKALSLLAPFMLVLLAAGVVAVWDAAAGRVYLRRFRYPLRIGLAGVVGAFLAATLLTTSLSVRYFWKPAVDELPRSVWQAETLRDLLPRGAPVQVLGRIGFNPRAAGMIAYFLVDNPLDGNLKTAYGALRPQRPGDPFEYIVLLDGVQPNEAGLDPNGALWRNELVSLYRVPAGWQAAAYFEGSEGTVSVGGNTGHAELQLTKEGWSLGAAQGGPQFSGGWWGTTERSQPEFTLLTLTGASVEFAMPDGPQTVELKPGLHTYRLPPVAAPGAVTISTGQTDQTLSVLSMRWLEGQADAGHLVSVQGIAALEIAASTNDGFDLGLQYASPDPRGGDLITSIEVYHHTPSGTLEPFASWEVAHAGRTRHGHSDFHLDPVQWTCSGGREDSQAPPTLLNGLPPNGNYTAQIAVYHMGDDVARWPWVWFSVRDGEVVVNATTPPPALTIVYLPPAKELAALGSHLPVGTEVLVVPDPDPDRSFIKAAAGFLELRKVVADAPLPRPDLHPSETGRVYPYALLPTAADPNDYGYEASGLVWSNRFARLYRRTESAPAALYRFPGGLDLRQGNSLRIGLDPAGSRLNLPDGRPVWGAGVAGGAADVEVMFASAAPQTLSLERAVTAAQQVSARVRGQHDVEAARGVFTLRQAAVAQPSDLVLQAGAEDEVTVLAVRVSTPSEEPDGLIAHQGLTALRALAPGSGTALTLNTVAGRGERPEPVIVGVDVYSRGQCSLKHFGYWALALPDGAGKLDVQLDPARKTAEIRDGGGNALPLDAQTWPAGDGLYRGVVFVREGERTDMLPAFQFRVEGQRVTETIPLATGRVHLFRGGS